MIRWSIKSLLSEGVGVVASCLGVAFAFLLVMFFSAIFSGESERIIAYPTEVDADVWVMQKGVANMHMAMSQLWDWKQDRVNTIEGVKETESILYLNAVINAGGRDWFTYIVGLTGSTDFSGPWSMHSGKRIPARGEAVIPYTLSSLTGLKIGDRIKIVDQHFMIVGLSSGTFSMANSIVFVTYDDLADIMSAGSTVSYIMVKAEEGVSSEKLASRIRNQIGKVNALSQKQFIANDYHMALQMGVEIISMMTVIGSALALIIVAFTSYVFITRKKRDLAIAKAMGFDNQKIYLSVLIQATLLTFAGLVVAAVFALLLFPLISVVAPEVFLKVTAISLIEMAIPALIVATVSALWSARQVATVDPVSVFHE